MQETFPQPTNPLEAEKALIEKVERLDCYDSEKVDLLLVYKGLKRASEVTLLKYFEEKTPEEQREKARKEFISICDDMQLVWEQFQNTIEGYEDTINFFVAKTRADLTAISSADYKDNENSLDTGLILGYPRTAVEAYVRGQENLIPIAEIGQFIPEELSKKDFMAFVTFRLSKEHWREELETAKSFADCIQKIDPALYDRRVVRYWEEMSKL